MTQRRQVLAGLAGTALTGLACAGHTQPAAAPTREELRPSVLSIGVSRYDHIPDLPSAVLDASLIAATFLRLGFRVTLLSNPTQTEFMQGLARFGAQAGNSPLALAYVAAHGGMLNGFGHFFFKDSRTIDDRVPETVLLQAMNAQPRQKILFLDSCRLSPIEGKFTQKGTEHYRAGIHVNYASQPGAPAIDGDNGHSPYASALQQVLETPGLEMPELSRRLRLNVLQATRGLQIPWDRSSLIMPVVLNPLS